MPCDVRIVAATNTDLADAVERQEFREDLYHRLSVVTIDIPPLRRRPEDIPQLVDFFIKKHATEFQRNAPDIGTKAMDALCCHEWTGNIRELQNRVQRALLMSDETTLRPDDFFSDGCAVGG